ncbi:MAG: hypothetical protein CMM61_05225 [Rhodospirillaceae bacterium]|nr:hypothetical protein [Rhodospirillaceae bacterium]|tara:strand:+ start:210 stop:437 length:228 start_codon:yes stop_codon:yes gene_type:complete
MHRQLLVYVSSLDPDYFVVTPPHLAHQAHVDFYWSASDDHLTQVPKGRAREILAQVRSDDADPALDWSGTCCHAA